MGFFKKIGKSISKPFRQIGRGVRSGARKTSTFVRKTGRKLEKVGQKYIDVLAPLAISTAQGLVKVKTGADVDTTEAFKALNGVDDSFGTQPFFVDSQQSAFGLSPTQTNTPMLSDKKILGFTQNVFISIASGITFFVGSLIYLLTKNKK